MLNILKSEKMVDLDGISQLSNLYYTQGCFLMAEESCLFAPCHESYSLLLVLSHK